MSQAWRRLSLGLALLLATACGDDEPAKGGGKAPDAAATPVSVIGGDAPAPGAVQPAPAPPSVAPGAAEPLTVVVATPQGLVDGAVRPTITFSRPVHAMGADDPAPPATLTPPVKGRWRWLGSSALEFAAEAPFPLSTAFRVSIPAGVRALDGGVLAGEFSYAFETPRTKPIGGDPVSPWQAYPWVEPQQVFQVVFTQRPKEASLTDRVRVVPAAGGDASPMSLVRIETPFEQEVRVAREQGKPEPKPPAGPADPSVGDADRRVFVQLRPSKPLALGTEYLLVFPPGIESAEGPLASEEEISWKFRTYGPLTVNFVGCLRWHGGCPDGPLTIQLNNPVLAKDLKAAVKVEPAVNLEWPEDPDQAQHDWILGGDFKPSTTYKVTIAAGLKDRFGQALAQASEHSFVTGDFEPYVNSWTDEALLEREHRLALPVTHVNVPSMTVRWVRLTPENAIPWLQNPYRDDEPPGMQAVQTPLNAPRNFRATSPLDLAPLFQGAPGAGRLAFVKVSWRDGQRDSVQPTMVQATGLGVHLKTSPGDTRVFVWRLSDGQAVPGAKVDLVDEKGKVMATAPSAGDGVAALPGVAKLPLPQVGEGGYPLYGPPFMAARVTLGDDVAFATTRDPWQLGPYRYDLSSDWEGAPPRAEGVVFADRGIYRPGDPLHVKGILRERSVGKLVIPAGRKVQFELLDPQGDKVQEAEGTLSQFGGVHAKLTMPADGRLGDYTVRVTDPSSKLTWATSARMAEYRPPEFLVDVKVPEGQRYFDGDPVKAAVEARYLFGAAMSGAEVKWAMHAKPGAFEPEKNDGFVFGRRYEWWNDDEYVDEQLVASGAGALDAEGRLTVEAGPADTPDDRPQDYTVEASVTDVNRQEVAGRVSFAVHPAAFYVGLKGPAGFATAGQPFTVQVVALSPGDEQRVAGAKVELKLVRHDWKTVQKRSGTGTFETVSEQEEVDAGTCTVTTNADVVAPATCTFTAEKSGHHDLVATATDAKGRTTVTNDGLWVVGPGYAAWLQDDDNRVEVVADKATYDVGETAKLLVQSPFPEAEAWVTVEREGILKQQRLRLKGTATPIEIPIDESMIPNAFVGVVLVRGRVQPPGKPGDPGRPAFRAGYREIRVVPASKRLNVEVTPDAPERRPGDDIAINVAVSDRAGKPAQAEVTLWAVDEGVLSLTGYEAPDPVDALYTPRGLSVRQSTNLLALVPQLRYGEKGRDQGGGGGLGESMTVRKRFETTPLFIGAVETDAQGRARVTGKLPDNLTTFRVMAVAITADDRGGRGRSKVVVNKPLMARPALPRGTRVGDVFAAGIVVHAKQAGAQAASRPVDVKAVVEGPIQAMEALERRVTVLEGKGHEVRFAFKATGDGVAKVRFTVTSGADGDAVELPIPVRLPVAQEAVAVYGDTPAGGAPVTEALATPNGIRPDVGGLQLTLASTALVGLGADAEALIDYPYGCLEQQSSRLVPLVALKSLLDRYGKDWLGERQPAEVVATTVKAIGAMQRPDGGFGYWPGSDCSSYWASAYATLALGEAQAAGYPVPPKMLTSAREYVRERLDVAQPCEWGQRGDEERALGGFVLARAGTSPLEVLRKLYDRRRGMALFGQALTAHAWAIAEPRGGRAKGMMGEIMNAARVTPSEVHFEESNPATYAALFSSDTRTTAIVLQSLLAVQPDHPFVPKIARYLLKIRGRGTYRSTQEAGFALMALSDFARIREKDVPAFEATVSLGGNVVAKESFQGRAVDAKQATLPVSQLPASGQQLPLVFGATGAGHLYYGALLRYAPAEMPTQARDDGLVVQRWYEPFGREGQTRSVVEGELVRVRLRIATNQERYYVVVADPLPSGLEAVDTQLRTTARLTPLATDEEGAEGEGSSETTDGAEVGWYSPFNHVEQRDERVVLFADRLPPGVHTYSYVARATTAGTFLLPPTRAEEMYAPEISGRSDGGTFWVHPRAEVSMR